MSITIVGGSPGCGKTSLSKYLANSDPQGVHLESDCFFRFLAHRLDPSLREARTQNETVIRSYLAAAQVYSEDGYSVYVDGVIGPWVLPEISMRLQSFDYLLVHAPLAITLERISSRPGQPSARPGSAARMHEQFSAVLKQYASHVVYTNDLEVAEVAEVFYEKQRAGVLSVVAQ